MKKTSVLALLLLLLFVLSFYFPKKIVEQTPTASVAVELDRPRMEQIIRLMPTILRKSEEFKRQSISLEISDEEYNNQFYQYLFKEQAFADRLNVAGFKSASEYENFYTTMIKMYILLLEQPEVLDTAVLSIPAHNKEVTSLLLKQAQEPNNQRLTETLKRLQYELTVYKNLVLVNTFMGQLTALNKQDEE